MKTTLATVCAVFAMMSVSLPLKAELKWLAKEYDFGAFKEAEGPRTGTVRFVNLGPDTTYVRNVRPSCGCTDASYTKELIAPGDTAFVSFTYNPVGRPGPFEKTVKAYIGDDSRMTVIRISGTVIGAPETLQSSYPHVMGPLRLQSMRQSAGEMRKGTARHLFINAYNQSPDTIRPELTVTDKALEAELTPRAIAPGEIATFGFYIRTLDEDRMGPVDYDVKVRADAADPHAEQRIITLSAVIVPDTAAMGADEIENSPQAFIIPEFVDLGDVDGTGKLKFSFEVVNEGNSLLEIAKVYSFDDNVKIKSAPNRIKPGKRGKVTGEVDASKLSPGPFRLHVEVMTNDGLHPVRTANIVGNLLR